MAKIESLLPHGFNFLFACPCHLSFPTWEGCCVCSCCFVLMTMPGNEYASLVFDKMTFQLFFFFFLPLRKIFGSLEWRTSKHFSVSIVIPLIRSL